MAHPRREGRSLPVAEVQTVTRDLARLYFEAEIAPGERVILHPVRAERLRARALPDHFTAYAHPVEVPVDSIRPFRPDAFTFSLDLARLLEMSVAYADLRLTALKCGDVEQIASHPEGLPIRALLRVPTFSCDGADRVALGIWNAGKTAVPFRVWCEGPTMPEAT